MSGLRFIELEGVRVHNLRDISLKIRHNSLTVICGVSGSGKSSLAFDTLYAEGQRRYIETFSPSARQFLDRVERPAADRIFGLPPAIAIRQQMRADGPRNTVGSRTEVLDSLRVLFSGAGQLFCPDCSLPVASVSAEAAAAAVIRDREGSRILIIAELVTDPDQREEQIAELIRLGYTRTIIRGKTGRLEDITGDDANSPLIVVDRLRSEIASESRMAEAISAAMKLSEACIVLAEASSSASSERMSVDAADWDVMRFSGNRLCPSCRQTLPELSSELLSFTSPLGACPKCEGTGMLTVGRAEHRRKKNPERREAICPICLGHRLNREAAAVQWGGRTLPQVCMMEISDLALWLNNQFSELDSNLRAALRSANEHTHKRLGFLQEAGLSYLSLSRGMKSLSGGEAQRVLLTTALGSGLINTLYVLDEPTSGLHASDTQKIIGTIRNLQKAGNTVVVVEHDPAFILTADEVIEIGPGAGSEGGSVIFQGTPAELLHGSSITATKLRQILPGEQVADRNSAQSGRSSTRKARSESIADPEPFTAVRKHRSPDQWLDLKDVSCHNIANLDVRLPLGVYCAVTGVSGSGKSSLIADTLYPAMCRELKIACSATQTGTIGQIDGWNQLENVLLLDQSPVRRSRRSVPATWIGVFNDIRILLTETHEAKKRNYSRAMFSFNAASGGRCPICEGCGIVTVAMQFLADIETVCEECGGRRFRPDVIEIRYRDRSVDDILNMTADEAFTFFSGHHRIQRRLNAVRQTGLGYLRLGQPLNTISGGEAQRLRIAAMLAGIPLSEGEATADNRSAAQLTKSGRTLFLLDEPSAGLHMGDIDKLLSCIDFLLQTGHSVIVIDHDEFLTSRADWQIELGPGAGKLGGSVVKSHSLAAAAE